MTVRDSHIRRTLEGGFLAAALFAASFAHMPAATAATADAFPRAEAERVLSFGYDVITERYLESVTPRHLALEGLRGLGSIDPGLAIEAADGSIRLSNAGGLVSVHAAPADDDADAWADLSVDLILAARAASPRLHDATSEDVYQAVFDAVLANLDKFSRYAGRKEAADHRASRNGFGGVGIRYTIENGRLMVQDVLRETPAELAGLRSGDQILRIDDVSVASLDGTRDAVRERLRGPMNSLLRLSVERAGRPLEISLRRGLVVPQTVTLDGLDAGIATIRIASFNQRTARGVAEAVDDAKRKLGRDFRGILLDLRGNPGGLLDQAVAIADLFMTRGRIVFTKGRHPEAMQNYTARGDDIADGLPIVVMVDGRSASAAEILSAALQDSGRAVVVGSASFGKGTVQTVIRLPNDGEMTLTWSRFHSPTGYALHGLGVLPTVCITDSAETADTALNQMLGRGGPIAAQLALWRSTPLEDEQGRNDLRALCPPASQRDWQVDDDVGRRLLGDHGLYARALSITAPKSASR